MGLVVKWSQNAARSPEPRPPRRSFRGHVSRQILVELRPHRSHDDLVARRPALAWYTAPAFPGSRFIPAILGTIVFVYGGLVFVRGARAELAARQPGMMTLISLAILVAFATSLAATFGLFQVDVWWELASLITIMVLGHWLEMRAISQARGALDALAALLPDTAERVTGAEIQTVPLAELRVDDIVLVRPGIRVPADGAVVEGNS